MSSKVSMAPSIHLGQRNQLRRIVISLLSGDGGTTTTKSEKMQKCDRPLNPTGRDASPLWISAFSVAQDLPLSWISAFSEPFPQEL